MRILSGLTGKMAPVAGPRGKAVPSPAAFTPVQHRITLVSQRRQGDSRATEVQHQAGAAANIMQAPPQSGSVESEAGRGNKSCSTSCPPAQDCSSVGTPGPCTMERGTGEHLSPYKGGSNRDSRDAASSRKERGTHDRQPVSCRGGCKDSRCSDPSKQDPGAAEYQTLGSRSSRSRVRQYRKRVCVRWGSLQWSLAMVLVIRSAATCQGAAHHHHHHHHSVATARPLTVA